MLLVGAVYLVAGIAFGALAAAAPSHQLRVAWRLAAWLASAIAFAAHIGYEHFRLLSCPRITASHTALSVAVGAFGLAVAANIHALRTASGNHRLLAVALVVWPVLAAVPAFVVALAAAAGLARVRPGIRPKSAPGAPGSSGGDERP
jgi:hypothetical protein